MKKYLQSCFLLLIPIFAWNFAFTQILPEAYASPEIWDKIPASLSLTENILRVIVFLLPLLFSLSIQSKGQKNGFLLYIAGVLIYFFSWIIQIYLPGSSWSNSMLGFMAPAYTPLLWLVGIGMIGKKSFVKISRLQSYYFIAVILFVAVHSFHAYWVFNQL